MRLLAHGGRTFSWPQAFGWAFSWGIGVGLGVAAGAWLTVVGEAGAPGVESLDIGTDFVVLPLVALGVVTVVHLVAQLAAATWRGMRSGGRPEATAATTDVSDAPAPGDTAMAEESSGDAGDGGAA